MNIHFMHIYDREGVKSLNQAVHRSSEIIINSELTLFEVLESLDTEQDIKVVQIERSRAVVLEGFRNLD
jgi:hypothetical protein